MKRWFPAALAALAALVVAAFAQPALAQDYTASSTSGQYLTLPSSGTTEYTLTDDSNTGRINLPFGIPYYGSVRDFMYIHSNGYINLAPAGTVTGSSYSNGTISTTVPARSTNTDCMVTAFWDDLNPGSSTTERIGWFVTGTAPNRILVVFWENVPQYANAANLCSMQIHLYETTGRIVFAYPSAAWTGSATSWSANICFTAGGSDNRYMAPFTATTNQKPSVDYQYDPRVTLFSGDVSIEAFASDETGLGNSTTTVPAGGLGVELRSGATVLASASVAADGSFELGGLALNSSGTGSVHLVTSSDSARVVPSLGSPPYSFVLASSVAFGSNTDVNAVTVGGTNDSTGAFRRPAQICLAAGRLYTWVRARTTDPLSRLDVVYDDASGEATAWVASTPSYLRVGGLASANPDAFDTSVVMRGAARQVVRSMTGATTSTGSLALDAAGDTVSALADGLGLYVYAILEDTPRAFDGRSSSATTIFDLESPSLVTAKGPNVGGWFAAAMYDLVDAANESHDQIDGTVNFANERPFEVFDALTSLSMVDFVLDWHSRGYDSASLAKILIHHGVLSDDAGEADDTLALATNLGVAGQRRTGRILNPFNEDWHAIQVAEAHDSFFADVIYDRASTDATVVLEIRDSSGAVLATGSFADATGPLRAQAGAVVPGTLFIRIAHVAGGYVGQYALQAYGRLSVTSAGPFAWTVGRALVQPLAITGGIGPFAISVDRDTPLPDGIALDAANSRIVGSPVTVGLTDYTINTVDSGNPANTHTVSLSMQVNPALAITAPSLTGIALGKVTDIDLGFTGGTPPITLSDFVGEIPEGLQLTPDFHVKGVPESAGGGRISFVATDVAGSTASLSTTLVSCARLDPGRTAIDLGAADAAAGFYFDVVRGTTVQIGLTTARKRTPRDLTVLLVGPDGRAVEGGQVKITRGKASLKRVIAPLSGRYFLVFQGADGLGATQLNAQLKTVLPRAGSGAAVLDFGEQTEITFGALDGAQLTLQGTTTLRMTVRVDALIRPDGTPYPLTGIVEHQANGKFKFGALLDQSGTWRLVLRPRPGPVGEVRFKYKLKQPKKFRYAID